MSVIKLYIARHGDETPGVVAGTSLQGALNFLLRTKPGTQESDWDLEEVHDDTYTAITAFAQNTLKIKVNI